MPTNCFRACTAVVTELSWNSSNDPDHRYIAEVEFVTADDWDRELGHLIYDLISSGDLSSEEKLKDSDAHIAWAKIKAVYPELSMQSIRKIKPNTLADDPAIKGLLGTTKTLHKRTASELHDGIQNYVGSGKKTSLPPFGERKENTQKMEFWPLIKVVRIYTKADALSTGAVIVDLVSPIVSSSIMITLLFFFMPRITSSLIMCFASVCLNPLLIPNSQE